MNALSGGAGVIANAATRSLISGTDFGDNIMAARPQVIGQTIGELFAESISSRNRIDLLATTRVRDVPFSGPSAMTRFPGLIPAVTGGWI